MACCHGHPRNPPLATSCCCHALPCQPPPPPPTDPILLRTIISQLLQNPQTPTFYQHPHFSPPTDAPSHLQQWGCGQYPHYQNDPQQRKQKKHGKESRFPPTLAHCVGDEIDAHYLALIASLCQRIETLELSFHRISSPASLSLRDLAARTIQTHFRAYLVRRSRALRELKELASIKSRLNILKSTLSIRKRVNFGSVSREAIDLIRRLETIEGVDQMVRDSKWSVSREIDQLLELMDEFCVKKHQVVSKTANTTKLARNDDNSRVLYASRGSKMVPNPRLGGKDSKCHDFNNNEIRLIENLRVRVERINSMSRALEGEAENSGADRFNLVGRTGSYIGGGKNYSDQHRKGIAVGKIVLRPNGKKRVGFLDNGNVTWVYDTDDGDDVNEPVRRHYEEEEVAPSDGSNESVAGLDDNKGSKEAEDDEAPNDSEEGSSLSSSQASDDAGRSLRRTMMIDSDEVVNQKNPARQNGKFVFAAPEPLKMEDRAGSAKKQQGVKIIG